MKKIQHLIHSNLDLSAVNLGVYLDLVAKSLLTEILLIKNSAFRRFGLIGNLDLGVDFYVKLTKFGVFLREIKGFSLPSNWNFI